MAAKLTIATSIAIHKQNGINIFESSEIKRSKSLPKIKAFVTLTNTNAGVISYNSIHDNVINTKSYISKFLIVINCLLINSSHPDTFHENFNKDTTMNAVISPAGKFLNTDINANSN